MKVCFVGSGSIGKRHICNINRIAQGKGMDLEIHLLRASAKELPEVIAPLVSRQVYACEELDTSYDAVFVTNPTYLHYETIKRLQGRTRCFFIEKPVFHDWRMDLSGFDETEGTVYYVACPLRYTRVLQRAKQILAGARVFSIRAISSSYLPDWRPGTDYRNTYSAHRDQGGGVRIDLIHEWDYLTYLFGFPKHVLSMSGKLSNLELDSEDLAVYIADYGDKLLELHLDYIGRQTRRDLEVITTDGVYIFDIVNHCIQKNGLLLEQYQEDANDKYVAEMEYFYSVMKREQGSTNDIRHSVQVLQLACGQKGDSYA